MNIHCLENGAYLITDNGKNILIDGVPVEYTGEYIKRIEKIIPVEGINAVIYNNASPDNVGCLEGLLEKNSNITVFSSTAGLRNIAEIINREFRQAVCKNKGTYENFIFYLIPGVPWPDSMVTYCTEEKILFSGTLFSGNGSEKLTGNNRVYMKMVMEAVSGREIQSIYTCSGIKDDVSEIIEKYKLSVHDVSYDYDIAVVYASSYGYTEKLAKRIYDTAVGSSYQAVMINAESELVDMEKCKSIALGVHTVDRNMPGSIWSFLSKLKVSDVAGKYYFVFGSSGWSGEGALIADKILSELRMRRIDKPLEVTFNPTEADLEKASDYILRLMEKVI